MATKSIDFTILTSTGVTAFYVALYVNFGAVLEWKKVTQVLKNPIASSVGFFCNFVFLPLICYILGLLLFRDNAEMRFGLFVTGISSMGAASSCWTVISSGNIELSITMNVINTLLACGAMPFWLFTLGKSILDSESVEIPYDLISQYICFSFIPLLVGIFIQYIFPHAAEIAKPILMGISFPFLIFIITVSIMRGFHIFSMPFSGVCKIVLAGFCLSSLGYSVGWFLSRALKIQQKDSLTIALGTVNVHSVIAITLLNFFTRPQREVAALFPISAIIFSPIPLIVHFIYNKVVATK